MYVEASQYHTGTLGDKANGLSTVHAFNGMYGSAWDQHYYLLFCCQIICIDEATASVDMQTDGHVQQAIRLEFVNSTVITIAHRLKQSGQRIL